VRSRVSVLYDEQRRPWRAVAVLENTAEHVRLEEAERARESAEASNRAKSNFLSRMSHELRTPLNAMLGFAQLLELDGERMEARHNQWIGQIRKAGWHLLEMINDVLDLSRIESGTVKLQLEPLRLEPLLAESMAMVEPQARERGVHLARVLTGDTTLRVFGDSTRIKQILTNLLSNAIKYNRDGGDVRLGTRRVDAPDGSGVVEVEVIDTGLGMNPDQLAQLFQPFNRLGRERGSAEGTGIGLVISKLLAERLGGALTVRSSESAGSTFTLALPLAADANGDSGRSGPGGRRSRLSPPARALHRGQRDQRRGDARHLRAAPPGAARHRDHRPRRPRRGAHGAARPDPARHAPAGHRRHDASATPAGRPPQRRHPGDRGVGRRAAGADRRRHVGRRDPLRDQALLARGDAGGARRAAVADDHALRLSPRCRRGAATLQASAARAGAAGGNTTRTRRPQPSSPSSSAMLAPCASTMSRTIASPSPLPEPAEPAGR
jgi:signal transduction histidine kinase